MKLSRINDEDIVTVRYGGSHYSVAEVRELKEAGFGAWEVEGGFWGEWTLRVHSLREFRRLENRIPSEESHPLVRR